MIAHGFNFVGKGAASNKKDAQTRAAWDFCDYLVKEGKMKEEELPTREVYLAFMTSIVTIFLETYLPIVKLKFVIFYLIRATFLKFFAVYRTNLKLRTTNCLLVIKKKTPNKSLR